MEKKANVFIIAILVLLVLVGGFFFFNNANSSSDNGQGIAVVEKSDSQVSEETNDEITPDQTLSKVKEFTVRESNFKLSLSTIQINKGDNVKITVINDGGTHNLFVEGYNERTEIVSSGNTRVIEFTADKEGTFKMWCEVASHRELGMEGVLTVA